MANPIPCVEAHAKDYEGPLEPPDEKRCQFERQSYEPFVLGDMHRVYRCAAKPVVIATEKKSTRKDGKRGSMSLCIEHMAMLAESAPGYCTFKEIKRASSADKVSRRQR